MENQRASASYLRSLMSYLQTILFIHMVEWFCVINYSNKNKDFKLLRAPRNKQFNMSGFRDLSQRAQQASITVSGLKGRIDHKLITA